MYNEDIELMALSTIMQQEHVKFFAFPSEIIYTNGKPEDLHNVEINVRESILEELNDQIGYFISKRLKQYYVCYSFNQDEMKQVSINFHYTDTIIDRFYLMCNESGLYAKFYITLNEQIMFYLVKLINYDED